MLGLTLATIVLYTIAGANGAPSLSLSLSGTSAIADSVSGLRVADVDNLSVRITVANTGDESLKLLNDPRGFLNTLETNIFDIVGVDGSVPQFTGALVRYSPEAALAAQVPEEWTLLEPGQSATVEHDLAGAYNFTLSGPGAYKFNPVATSFLYETSEGTLAELEAVVEVVPTIEVSGVLASSKLIRRTSDGHSLQKRATYRSCTASQQSGVNAGINGANSIISSARSDLANNPSGSSRYVRWFGTYSSSRFNTVRSAFNNLNGRPTGWTYDCSCRESSTYAYVYPSQYGLVYLCTLYFNVPTSGVNSKSDTIVHEGTHFPQIVGTDDWAYGTTASLNLARSNPSRAVDNADNYAYFADNA